MKVIDFGVAKADDSELRTSTGILKGKNGYMSPEHARGERLDPRADLWSLGVVLWEMLVTDRLFSAGNPSATLKAIAEGEIPSPRQLRPEVPRPLDELCMCLLVRDKRHRVQSCAELVALLAQVPDPPAAAPALATFLAERFPDEAAQGRREAEEAARTQRNVPMPKGLVEGGSPAGPFEGLEGPTRVFHQKALLALARARSEPSDTQTDR